MIPFDPQLILLGPPSCVILDGFGVKGDVIWAMAYPSLLGLVPAGRGHWRFARTDLV